MVNLGAGLAWGRLLPSWPLLVGLAGLARALAQPAALLHDPDTYLHIAAGRLMLAHRARRRRPAAVPPIAADGAVGQPACELRVRARPRSVLRSRGGAVAGAGQ